MALPCQKHDIAWLGSADRGTNRGRAVMKDLEAAASTRSGGEERGSDRFRDAVRILTPRVFVGDPHQVRARCGLPDRCTSTWVALPCSTGNEQQASFGAAQLARHRHRRRQ